MTLFRILLLIHIVCGSTSLLLGLVVLLLKKGNKRHRQMGRIYFIFMLTASLVALPMAYLHSNYFLFIIGIFTAYMLLTGKRYLKIKSLADVKWTDHALSLLMALFGLAFIVSGVLQLAKSNYFGTVLVVFGSISMLFVYQDYKNYTGKSKIKNYWLTTHIQRMTGSYVASATAFLVVNNTRLPGIVVWLLPTILFVPLIIKWTRKYKVSMYLAKAGA